MMENVGPDINRLTKRLSETPTDFMGEPKIGNGGELAVAALFNDLLKGFGRRASAIELAIFESNNVKSDRNRLQLCAITIWLLSDDWFVQAKLSVEAVLNLFLKHLNEVAETSRADKFVSDDDRREELVRVVLARLNFRPLGETIAQARDRLSALSSIERKRLLTESREAEKRAREIREALARKAAQESADKWTRE